MNDTNYVDTWALAAPMMDEGRNILTCYGIRYGDEARELAKRILASGLAGKVEVRHITKEKPRSRWKTEVTVLEGANK